MFSYYFPQLARNKRIKKSVSVSADIQIFEIFGDKYNVISKDDGS